MNEGPTIGHYLLSRLPEFGIRHMFGIPSDYVLTFYDLVEKSSLIEMINTCAEQGAGFAVDAFTERPMLDGAFNDVHPWHFSKLPELPGSGGGFIVRTEKDLQHALQAAEHFTESYSIIDVQLDRHDRSPVLIRFTEKLGKRVCNNF